MFDGAAGVCGLQSVRETELYAQTPFYFGEKCICMAECLQYGLLFAVVDGAGGDGLCTVQVVSGIGRAGVCQQSDDVPGFLSQQIPAWFVTVGGEQHLGEKSFSGAGSGLCIGIFSLSAASGEVFNRCAAASGHKHYLVSTECGHCIRRFLGNSLLCLGDWLDCLQGVYKGG